MKKTIKIFGRVINEKGIYYNKFYGQVKIADKYWICLFDNKNEPIIYDGLLVIQPNIMFFYGFNNEKQVIIQYECLKNVKCIFKSKKQALKYKNLYKN